MPKIKSFREWSQRQQDHLALQNNRQKKKKKKTLLLMIQESLRKNPFV